MQTSSRFSIILLASVITGGLIGFFVGPPIESIKPLGDLFLNLLFTAAVPLVFFSIASAVCLMNDLGEFGKIAGWMLAVFILTGILSSIVMILGVTLFPPVFTAAIPLAEPITAETSGFMMSVLKALTVSDFSELFSKNHMLALIVFSLLVGLAAAASKDEGAAFRTFLVSGNRVMLKLIQAVMMFAPVGLGVYFAYLTGVFGPQLGGPYLRSIVLYYILALLYFFIAFSVYAWMAQGRDGFKKFWSNILPVALTSLGTGSSIATIPVNLQASDNIGVPRKVSEIVIPLGATIHMDGSCLSAILKIALLFQVYDVSFMGWEVFAGAIAISLLAGTVMNGIPGGGFLGEVMIVTFYGFPPEALPLITTLGILVDPPATMVNAAGDNVAGMLVAKFTQKSRY